MKIRYLSIKGAIGIATFYTMVYALPLRTPMYLEQPTQQELYWNILLVEFQEDNSPVTTGDGLFLQSWEDANDEYLLDPPPHNTSYFHSHLKAISNYWRNVTKNTVIIDTSASCLLPQGDETIKLPHEIRYYYPANTPDSIDSRLAKMVYQSVRMLYEEYDVLSLTETIIIYHAGVGQDFDFSDIYDSTPYDIPSFYFDEHFLSTYLSLDEYSFIQSLGVKRGIVLPEMQNQLGLNIALNGTEILMSGFLLGLPPLYNTETGKSGVGIFGLMDHGSNNGNGLLPIQPSAFERMIMNVQSPRLANKSSRYSLLPEEILKIPISSREYFLVEYRKNAGYNLDSLYQIHQSDTVPESERFYTYLDALEWVQKRGLISYTLNPETGVLESVDNYDITLPGTGLLIWHVYDPEKTLFEFPENPNGQAIPLLRLEEADGGYDIGKNYGLTSGPVNQGWKWDMWFSKNPGFFDNNKHLYLLRDIEFSDRTHPNTRSFSNIETGLRLQNFSFTPDSASFTLDFLKDRPDYYPGFTAYGIWNFNLFDTSIPYGLKENYLVCLKDTGFVYLTTIDINDIKAEKTQIIPYENTLILIYSTETESVIKHYDILQNPFGATLIKSHSLTHEITLNDLLLQGNQLFLPLKPSGFIIYNIDKDHFLMSGPSPGIPKPTVYDESLVILMGSLLNFFDENHVEQLPFFGGTLVSYDNYLLITDAEQGGFYFYDVTNKKLINSYAYQQDLIIEEIIPLDLPETQGPDLLILGKKGNRKHLVLTDSDGHPWNGFPVKKDYETLRIFFKEDQLRIVGIQENGRIDIFDKTGSLEQSFTLTPQPITFFLALYPQGVAIMSESDRIMVDGDSLHWAYTNGDIWGSRSIQKISLPSEYFAEELIANNIIYNYPNPVSDEKTFFRYFAITAEFVDIKIYDLQGKFVEHLKQTPIQQQWNEIPWDVRKLDSGVYLAKITVQGAGKEKTYIIKPALLK